MAANNDNNKIMDFPSTTATSEPDYAPTDTRPLLTGYDSLISSQVIIPAKFPEMPYILKVHDRIIMNQDTPTVDIHYGIDSIEPIINNLNSNDDSTSNGISNILNTSPAVEFSINVAFIDDDSIDADHAIRFTSGDNDDSVEIKIMMLNWGLNMVPDKFTDIATKRQKLIDCGNGVGLYLEMIINGSPVSNSYIMDIYIWSHIDDISTALSAGEE